MRILVTGGKGYIGSHVVRRLAGDGHHVVVVDNLSTTYEVFYVKRTRFYKRDIRGGVKLAEVMMEEGIDTVIHLAGSSIVSESKQIPIHYYYNNVGGIISVLSSMKEAGVSRLIFSSTASVYGGSVCQTLHEGSTVEPQNPYGRSKLMMEQIIEDATKEFDFNYIVFRFFNVAGSSKDGLIGEVHSPETHLIPILLEVAAGEREMFTLYGNDYNTKDGTCVRDFIHVEDLVDAHVKGLRYLEERRTNEIFNLGGGKGHTVFEVIQMVAQITGKNLMLNIGERREGDPETLVASTYKARRLLGWKPENDLDDMIYDAWQFKQKGAVSYGNHL